MHRRALLTTIAMLLPACALRAGPPTLRTQPSHARRALCLQRAELALAPPDPARWEQYPLPAARFDQDRGAPLTDLLALRDPGGARVDAIDVDPRAGVVRVLATQRGHELVVIRMGGCVDHGRSADEGRVVRVFYLDRIAAPAAVARVGRTDAAERARIVADVPTNAVVVQGAPADVAAVFAALASLECAP